jgi:putative ubiquitin-RnfH superfamily antitoxin RatB of RatAB toxin-antitoxin module
MTMTYTFENPPGTPVNSNRFAGGETLRVKLHVTGVLGLPEWGIPAYVQISEVNLVKSAVTDAGGNCSLDFDLPNQNVGVHITMWHDYVMFVGDDKIDITAAIGTGNIPEPEGPPDTPDASWETLVKYLPWLVLGGAALYIYSILPKKR